MSVQVSYKAETPDKETEAERERDREREKERERERETIFVGSIAIVRWRKRVLPKM
jgi:hypothetical protein